MALCDIVLDAIPFVALLGCVWCHVLDTPFAQMVPSLPILFVSPSLESLAE